MPDPLSNADIPRDAAGDFMQKRAIVVQCRTTHPLGATTM
jgi:hypothetical protein